MSDASRTAKRALDLAIAGLAAVVAGPFMLVIALAIRLEDRGPALLRQSRVGMDGEDFDLLKFRTMIADAHTVGSGWLVAERDPRITRVGRVLRRWSLDELPQMFNVLRGEMSIVGPRPEQPRYVEQLEHSVPFYSRRHRLRPGLTGWAQLHCGYGGSAQGTTWKLSHDLYYLRHRSLALDAQILVRTLTTLVSARQFADLIHRPLVFGPALEELEPEAPVELAPAST
jgi:lipopolysaccharide/colanic/teichoic acid biosynthesis glycosyltransferase